MANLRIFSVFSYVSGRAIVLTRTQRLVAEQIFDSVLILAALVSDRCKVGLVVRGRKFKFPVDFDRVSGRQGQGKAAGHPSKGERKIGNFHIILATIGYRWK